MVNLSEVLAETIARMYPELGDTGRHGVRLLLSKDYLKRGARGVGEISGAFVGGFLSGFSDSTSSDDEDDE